MHDLPASTIEAVEDALETDRQELGRMIARSAFAQEAVIAAAEDARRRLGRGSCHSLRRSSATARRGACWLIAPRP